MIIYLKLTNDDQTDYQDCRIVEMSKLKWNTPLLCQPQAKMSYFAQC